MAMQLAASPDSEHYVAKSPPPPPPLSPHPPPAPAAVKPKSPHVSQGGGQRAPVDTGTTPLTPGRDRARHDHGGGGGDEAQVLNGIVLVLRAAAALLSFVAMALVASCRHGDWMDFLRYQEYRYLLGVSVVAFVYSAAQALKNFGRMRRGDAHASFLDFAGDQAVAYLLVTASAAALPITIRMRSAVVNVFTDAIAASIVLGFLAFAALALSAMLSRRA
ncbi:CASP-like protein 4B1 [Triticum dicoccoides]|uniref:CASP-like protein 4B1 n=1 Tax=Triticum dicoccoides TaxID=85692 RepID=UPI00188DD87B|nr:CASP-like protein 4B1 [Triticum dicoccoides]